MHRHDLLVAINKNGGSNKFRKLLGYKPLKMPDGYYTDDNIIKELSGLIEEIGHFPSCGELETLRLSRLVHAMAKRGGINKFRILLGTKLFCASKGYYTDDNIIQELKLIIEQIKHFPTESELYRINRSGLGGAISRYGGYLKFRELMGYGLVKKPSGYWTEETIIKELKSIIDDIGHFPMCSELRSLNKNDLVGGIYQNGGLNKFRKLMGYDFLRKKGYWNDETIINELRPVIDRIGCFPTCDELKKMDMSGLLFQIIQNGGMNKFRTSLGYTVSMYEEYISNLFIYISKRSKKSEKIVKKILTEYCILHSIPEPKYNVKITDSDIIEFVCSTGKTIGIDVTNTKSGKSPIYRKWTHKDYHKYLDELWVVVFSDSFTEEDYEKWNNDSPENVKVFSIYQFLKELDYSLNTSMRNKIDKYCKCTFHTKDELKGKREIVQQSLQVRQLSMTYEYKFRFHNLIEV